MIVTYRNNRVVPVIIISICIGLLFYLMGPLKQANGLGTWEFSQSQNYMGDKSLHISPYDNPINETSTNTPDEQDPFQKWQEHEYSEAPLFREDVLLIMKTGGTTMWKRLLVHLSTTLFRDGLNTNNTVIYSDHAERVGEFQIIDVLTNISDSAKAMPDFEVYRQFPEYLANNYYVEASGVAGDEWGPSGGWIIDKYKFLPLMDHAGRNWPNVKWYIYMEDDTYLFLPNVLTYLSKFDSTKPHYLGSYAAKSDVVFAHGGAGFALSRGAWEKSFGKNPNMTEDYYSYAADHCCGDQVLGHALNDYGVRFGEHAGDEKFTWGFNPLVHWSFAFSRANWCRPLFSWHKVHNQDVSRYYALEKRWNSTKPLRHRDFFLDMILPNIQMPIQWWDNMASLYEVTSANKDSPPVPGEGYDSALWANAWTSASACEAACKGWSGCMQWTYVEDLCKMDNKLIMGQGFAPGMFQRKTSLMHVSGWLVERLENWVCEKN